MLWSVLSVPGGVQAVELNTKEASQPNMVKDEEGSHVVGGKGNLAWSARVRAGCTFTGVAA